ncbi:MAG: ABC transporter permease [Ruminococcaceae bacterium]|nr:ABC transporter permease [Oscillospiraceae bacterium]
MFKTLLAVRLRAMFAGFGKNSAYKKSGKKTDKKSSSAGKIILYALLFGYVGVVFFFMFYSAFSTVLMMTGEENRWFYFALAGLMAFAFMIFGSVFTAKSVIYEPSDNELLLSMPVPPFLILASRLVSLFLLEYAFGILIILPAFLVYALNVGFTFAGALFFIIGFILVGILSLAVICLLAYSISALTKRARNKSLVTTVFSLAFLGVYFYVYFNITNIISIFAANMDRIESVVESYLFPFYHLGVSAADGNILSALIFWLCALIPFALVVLWLTKSFINIAFTKSGAKHKKYVKGEMKTSSPEWALTKKEISYFFSVPVYILNCGLGLVMSVGYSVLMAVKSKELREATGALMGDDGAGSAVLILVLLFFAAMNMVSACSVSLEGKRLWIAKSLPLSGKSIVGSKIAAHCIICLPLTALSGIILWVGMGMDVISGLGAVIVPSALTVLMGAIGVAVNLKHPVFDWENEAVPVKQSGATFITMMSGFGIVLLTGGAALALYFLLGLGAAVLSVSALMILAAALALWLVMKASDRLFAAL